MSLSLEPKPKLEEKCISTICIRMCIYVRVYMYARRNMNTFAYVYTYAYLYSFLYIFTYICMHIHVHTLPWMHVPAISVSFPARRSSLGAQLLGSTIGSGRMAEDLDGKGTAV